MISYITHMVLCGEIALKGNIPFSALSEQTIESTCFTSKVVFLSSGSSHGIVGSLFYTFVASIVPSLPPKQVKHVGIQTTFPTKCVFPPDSRPGDYNGGNSEYCPDTKPL